MPSQLVAYNYPFATSINDLHSQALYATDVMSIRRVTLNYGIRWERYHNFYPEQTREAGEFSAIFPEKTYPKQDVLTWIDTVPRVGAAWDVMGNGKTVVKGSFGLFGDTMGDLYANAFNPNAAATNTYAWTGPCVTTPFKNNTFNNTSCDVTPDFLASLPSRTPISATGGLNSVLSPDLKQNKTYEYTARLERQLIPNVAVSAGYVYHKVDNLYANLQYLRPYETWIPATPATPFLDHLGNPVTIYTFPASQVGVGVQRAEGRERPAWPIEYVPQLRGGGHQALLEEMDRVDVVLDDQEPPVDRRRQQPAESQRRSVPADPDVGLGSARECHLPFALRTLHVRLVSGPVGRARAADAGVHLAGSPAGLGDVAHG